MVDSFISFTVNVKDNGLAFHECHHRTTMAFPLNSISFKVTKLVLVMREITISLIDTATEVTGFNLFVDVANLGFRKLSFSTSTTPFITLVGLEILSYCYEEAINTINNFLALLKKFSNLISLRSLVSKISYEG